MLVEQGYNVMAVVANYEQARSRTSRELEIASVAHAYHIPVLMPKKLSEIADELRSYDAIAGVLVAYGKIVPQSIIDIFPRGIINIHPSLLPLHRGPTPLESVILNGEDKTGVSIMALAKAMDAGPVYAQSEVALTGKESKQELADNLLDVSTAMLREVLPGILDGSIVALPQDESHATYDKLIAKDQGAIDWHKPAEQLEREVRAFAEWPKSRTQLAGKDVIITAAHAVPSQAPDAQPGDVEAVRDIGAIMVATGNGTLCIERLKPAGKGEMSAADFLAGYDRLRQRRKRQP
jgi:methionyl-tRNA formyltransferase